MRTKTFTQGAFKQMLLAAVILPLLAPFALQAQKSTIEARKKTEQYNRQRFESAETKSSKELESRKPSLTAGMACDQCKSVSVTRSQWTHKFQKKVATVGTRHECAACESSVKTVGHGKGKQKVFTHVCRNSGEAAASCCVPHKSKA